MKTEMPKGTKINAYYDILTLSCIHCNKSFTGNDKKSVHLLLKLHCKKAHNITRELSGTVKKVLYTRAEYGPNHKNKERQNAIKEFLYVYSCF